MTRSKKIVSVTITVSFWFWFSMMQSKVFFNCSRVCSPWRWIYLADVVSGDYGPGKCLHATFSSVGYLIVWSMKMPKMILEDQHCCHLSFLTGPHNSVVSATVEGCGWTFSKGGTILISFCKGCEKKPQL